MFFQINSIPSSFWYSNCTTVINLDNMSAPFNSTIDSASYIGLQKVDHLSHYLRYYILMIVLLSFEAVVRAHQAQYYLNSGKYRPQQGIIFENIKREDADKGLVECIKFLVNYAFYKYGLQICMIMTVITMTVRMDVYSVIYGIFLGVILLLSRRQCFIAWPVYIIILALMLFLQYLACLGLPAALCYEYPWAVDSSKFPRNLQSFLFLPSFTKSPDPHKLIVDFFQLLFVTQQLRVFIIENSSTKRDAFGGGSNSDVGEEEHPDFKDNFIDVKDSYLDYVKTFIFVYMYWVTLIVMFLAGTNRISLFCMGYLIATFFFLWLGQDLLVKPKKKLLQLWSFLIAYCYWVLIFKCALQIVGCVYIKKLTKNYCWLVQLFSIVCIQTGNYEVMDTKGCNLTDDEAGMMWDAICFVCLILQLRVYKSPYFRMVVLELQVQNQLASRGAELINQRMMEQIANRKAAEDSVLANIKRKMEKIKLRQNRLAEKSALLESKDHYQVIRSGDYFMFEDDSEDETDSSVGPTDIVTLAQDSSVDFDKKPGPLEILNTAWTQGAQEAIDKAGRRPSLMEDQPIQVVSQGRRMDSTVEEETPDDLLGAGDGVTDDAVPSTSTSKPSDDVTEVRDACDSGEKTPADDTIGVKVETNARLAWAIFGGLLNYLITLLEGISKNQRDIATILDQEKAAEKKKLLERRVPESETSSTLVNIEGEPEGREGLDPLDIKESTDAMALRKLAQTSKSKEEEFHQSTPKLFQLGVALWDAMMSQSAMVCYFMMVLNQLVSASLLSLPYAFSVFLWAMLSVPRPTKTYWITVITYTEAIVVIKYLFQFGFFPWNEDSKGSQDPFSPPRIIGIEKNIHYAAFDLVLLFTLFIHRSVLKRYGLWKDTEDVEADLEKAEALSRLNTPVATPVTTPTDKHASFDDITDPEELVVQSQRSIPESASSGSCSSDKKGQEKSHGVLYFLWRPFKSFYKQMTNPKLNAATDVYSMMFLCDFINFFIVVFGYKSFGPTTGSSQVVTGLLSENKVPMPFLLMVLLQFLLIIGDRALYLRKYVFGKFLYQIILMVGVHAWMFFVLPAVNNRGFTENTVAQLWYFVKCIYFGFSAYQIRSGYPTRILGNFLTRQYNYLNLILFKGFLGIPFLLELRCLMDWIWTDTTLALTSWLQMEDIFANIFQIKCFRNAEIRYPTPRGQKRNLLVKYGMGGVVLCILIFIIWFPLLTFSLAHTVLYVTNKPIDCSIHVQFGGYEPIFVMSAQQQFIKNVTQNEYEKLQSYYSNNSDVSDLFTFFKADDLSLININGSSTSLWGISPPSKEALLADLVNTDNSINLYYTLTFTREPKEGMTSSTVSAQFVNVLDPNNPTDMSIRRDFKRMIENTTKAQPPVEIVSMLPRYLRVKVSKSPQELKSMNEGVMPNISFKLYQKEEEYWWGLEEESPADPFYPDPSTFHQEPYLTFLVFSDRVAPPSLSFITGYGIISLYTSVVLVLSRLLRTTLFGNLHLIKYKDFPCVDYIMALLDKIYVSRSCQEFEMEEVHLAKLLFLYRSPETMIKVTRIKMKEKQE